MIRIWISWGAWSIGPLGKWCRTICQVVRMTKWLMIRMIKFWMGQIMIKIPRTKTQKITWLHSCKNRYVHHLTTMLVVVLQIIIQSLLHPIWIDNCFRQILTLSIFIHLELINLLEISIILTSMSQFQTVLEKIMMKKDFSRLIYKVDIEGQVNDETSLILLILSRSK